MTGNLSTIVALCLSLILGGAVACQNTAEAPAETPKPSQSKETTFLLSQAQFSRNAEGKPAPGAAKLRIVEMSGEKTKMRILEDEESRVFHKAICTKSADTTSIWTIGATGAHLKEWKLEDLSPIKTHYSGKFGGKWDRLRDIEHLRGADGQDLWAIATHDQGHVLVIDKTTGAVTTLHTEKTTFVHEVEVGDFNGDGLQDFATTPSKPNKSGKSQPGRVDAYLQAKDGSFKRMKALGAQNRHAKEILATDWNGDGTAELYVVLEGELGPSRKLVKPVDIVRAEIQQGEWVETGRVSIPRAKQARVLLAANVDSDATPELVVTTMRSGVWALDSYDAPARLLISGKLSSGFEHAAAAVDVDDDGVSELLISSEDQDALNQWKLDNGRWTATRLATLGKSEITWSIELCQ